MPKVIELTNEALKRLDIAAPRIAVAGLNPHCGESGLFGAADEREIAPAVAAARDTGISTEAPLPADTLFSKLRGGQYDAVVAMYHDQGHIPTKLLGFHYDAATGTGGQMTGVVSQPDSGAADRADLGRPWYGVRQGGRRFREYPIHIGGYPDGRLVVA